ncbi:hypothetical protein F3513_23010, partial [Escherichia coli]|nr:hypothetical protein [Escherichia coli]
MRTLTSRLISTNTATQPSKSITLCRCIHHHLFENLRRKGHHCHGLTHLSWAERKIFYRVLGKK